MKIRYCPSMRSALLILSLVLTVLGAVAVAQTVTLNPDGSAPRGRRALVNCDGGPNCTEASPEGLSCNPGGPGFSAAGCVATGFRISAPFGQNLLGGEARYWTCDPASDAGWYRDTARDKVIADAGAHGQSFGPFDDVASFNGQRTHIQVVNGVRGAGGDGGVLELVERCCLKTEGCP